MSDSIRSIGNNPYSNAGYASSVPQREDIIDKATLGNVQDMFLPSERAYTPEGRLRFILSFDDHSHEMDARQMLEAKTKDSEFGQHCKLTENYPLVNGFAMDVEPGSVGQLLCNVPVGAKVAMDRRIAPFMGDDTISCGAKRNNGAPEDIANKLIGIDKVWEKGFTGKGQTIAVIDSGIHPHPDLKDKIVGWLDVRDGVMSPCDDYGHGTHVAGIAAGNGVASAGKHKGVAPDANLVGVRISNVSEAIKGIQWVIEHKDEYNIGVINMSLGDFALRSYKDDPWAQAAEKAMEAGIVVCVAAGNDGPSEFNINTPGIHPDVITVGALDDKGTLDRKDDTVADFSSRGPTQVDRLHKPDLLAPGVNVFGPLSPGSHLDTPDVPHDGQKYFAISGTSMATPMVAGMAAILLQANPKLTHQEIKEILVRSCDNYLPDEPNIQGAGVINAQSALEMATTWDSKKEAGNVAESVAKNRTSVPVGMSTVTGDVAAEENGGFLLA